MVEMKNKGVWLALGAVLLGGLYVALGLWLLGRQPVQNGGRRATATPTGTPIIPPRPTVAPTPVRLPTLTVVHVTRPTPLPSPTVPPTPTSSPAMVASPTLTTELFLLAVVHSNDTWGYVRPCG